MKEPRGFEIVSKYRGKGIDIPKRSTNQSAGYDFAAAIDIVVPSIWELVKENKESLKEKIMPSILVPTGIKAYMPAGEYLMLVNRSSNPLKNNLSLPNGIGIIDSDYYNSEETEGEIFVQLINYGLADYEIKKGDRIAQGIFNTYKIIDEEGQLLKKRTGGFGSTGKY